MKRGPLDKFFQKTIESASGNEASKKCKVFSNFPKQPLEQDKENKNHNSARETLGVLGDEVRCGYM